MSDAPPTRVRAGGPAGRADRRRGPAGRGQIRAEAEAVEEEARRRGEQDAERMRDEAAPVEVELNERARRRSCSARTPGAEAEALVGDAKSEADAGARADPGAPWRAAWPPPRRPPPRCSRRRGRCPAGCASSAARSEEQAERILRDVQAAHRRMQADLRVGPEDRPAPEPGADRRGPRAAPRERRPEPRERAPAGAAAQSVRGARRALVGRPRAPDGAGNPLRRPRGAELDDRSRASARAPAAWPWPSTPPRSARRARARAGAAARPVTSANSGCGRQQPHPDAVAERRDRGDRGRQPVLGRARRRVGRPRLEADLPRVHGHGHRARRPRRCWSPCRRRRARPRSGRFARPWPCRSAPPRR